MGLSRTVCEIHGDFGRISQIFPTPMNFAPLLKGFPWNLVPALGVKKARMMGLPGRERSLTVSCAVWLQSTSVTDRQTVERTDGRRATAKTALTHSVAR